MSTSGGDVGDPPGKKFAFESTRNGSLRRSCKKKSLRSVNFIAEGGKKWGRKISKTNFLAKIDEMADVNPSRKKVSNGNGKKGNKEEKSSSLEEEVKQAVVVPGAEGGETTVTSEKEKSALEINGENFGDAMTYVNLSRGTPSVGNGGSGKKGEERPRIGMEVEQASMTPIADGASLSLVSVG